MKRLFSSTVVLFLWVGLAFGGGRSPISMTEMPSGDVHGVNKQAAKEKVARMLGSDSFLESTPVIVRYEDRAALGAQAGGTGWLIRGMLQLQSREPISINSIVDGTTGRLVVAFNDSTGNWPAPSSEEYDLPGMLKQAGWVMNPEIPDTMQSTIVQVLESATQENGADPTDAGQVVVRPRRVSPRFPAKMVDGKLVPVEHTRVAWIVQVCGRQFQESRPRSPEGTASSASEFYFTERFFQLKDGSLSFASGFYMP
jgi:hypothetical protein